MSTLLLLVDLQRDYLRLPDLEPSADAVVERARALLAGFRDRGLPVVHVWTTVTRDRDQRMRHWKQQGLWRCEAGSEGHRPAPGLEPHADEAVVHKTGFDPFAGGELELLLREHSVQRIAIAGVHLHACVRQAALGAHEREWIEQIWVAEDAVTSDDHVHAAITRRYLQDRAVDFLPVTGVLDALDRAAPTGHADAGGPTDARALVAAAATRCGEAAPSWRALGVSGRAEILLRAADLLEPRADGLAQAMATELGKPVRYGVIEAQRAARMLRAIATRGLASSAAEPILAAELHRRPLGVIAAITPWNNPVYIPLGKLAAALAYGNAVLWKPAPGAQAIAERLAAILTQAGLPAGVLELVAGGRREAQLAMSDPAVDGVTLTGSSLAGFAAQETCARRRVPLQAELGGNNAALVWSDADLGLAAKEIAHGAFAQAGQRCTANRRVVVEGSRHAELLALLRRETAALEWGDPHDPDTHVGPMVGHEQRDRLAETVERAGLPSTAPHRAPASTDLDAAWYPPTIVCCEAPASELVQRETFGPLLVVQRAEGWDHALALVNGVSQGLAAALFSRSEQLTARFLEGAQAGILKLNRSTADAEVDVPFGGWKASAIGPPEHGAFDLDFYTRPQTVYR